MRQLTDLKLFNFTYYPVKIVKYVLDNDTKEIVPESIYVFVGDQSEKMKQYFKNIENQDYEKQNGVLYIPKEYQIEFKKMYGKKWKEILGFYLYDIETRQISKKSTKKITKKDTSEEGSDHDIFESDDTTITEYGNVINFIFNYIYNDDKIGIIKKKIHFYANIPISFQHLWIENENENVIQILGYNYIVNTTKQDYSININKLFIKKNTTKILDIPIDKELYRSIVKERVKGPKKTNNKVLYESIKIDNLTNYNSEIKVISFEEFYRTIDKSLLYNIFRNNKIEFEKFKKGFVYKFWPFINFNKTFIKTTNIYKGKKSILSSNDDYYINLIHNIDMNKILLHFENISIIQTHFHINYKIINYKTKDYINLRNLFDFYNVNDYVPFIKYKNELDNTMDTKIYKPLYHNDKVKNWINKMPHGIHFRLRLNRNKTHPDYHKFGILNMQSDGKIECRLIWEEQDNANFKNVINSLETIKHFIIDINKLDNIFNGFWRIDIPDKTNIELSYINISKRFTLNNNNKIDFNKLNYLAKCFTPFLKFDETIKKEYPINMECKYIRVSPTSLSSKVGRHKNMENFIIKYRHEKTKDEIISIMIIEFRITNEEAETIYDDLSLYTKKRKYERKVKLPGITIKITTKEDSVYKIHIQGSTSICQLMYIYNFLIRFVHIYDNLDKLFKKKEYSILEKDFKKIYVPQKKISKKIEKKMTQIKKLQQLDKNLYPSGKLTYARKCQKTSQPDFVMTEKELFKQFPLASYDKKNNIYWLDKKKNVYALKYKNTTYPGNEPIYICTNKKNPYLGFLKEKNINNDCMPCCYSRKSIGKNVSQNTNTRFKRCIGKEIEMIQGKTIQSTYLLQAEKDLDIGRYGKLPSLLNSIINLYPGSKCNLESDGKRLSKGKECFFRVGILQNKKSFLNVVAYTVLKNTKKEKNYDNVIIKNIETFLYNNKDIFKILENSVVQQKFKTIKNFIQFLKSDNIIDETYTWDLLSQPKLFSNFKKGINIIIFFVNKDNDLKFLCQNQSEVINVNKHTLMLIKYEDNTYYPIYKILNKGQFMICKKMSVPFTENKETDEFYDKNIIENTILKIYKRICKNKINKTKWKNRTGFNLGYDLNKFIRKFQDKGDFEINSQVLDNYNNVLFINIYSKKNRELFSFPIRESKPNYKISKLSDKRKKGNYKTIIQFIKQLEKNNIIIHILHFILDKTEKKVIGMILNIGYNIYIKPISKGKVDTKNNKIGFTIQYYDIDKINDSILESKEIEDDRIKNMKNIIYEKELYNLFELEISKYINNEKNIELRKIIEKIMIKKKEILSKQKDKKITTFKKLLYTSLCPKKEIIMKKCWKKYLISKNDLLILKNIYNYNEPYIKKKKYIDKNTFDFDFKIRHQINTVIENKNKKELSKIIDTIINKIIFISPKKREQDLSKNIREICYDQNKRTCSTRPHCYFSSKGCKLVMSNDYVKYFKKQFLEEISRNELIKNKILYDNVETTIDKTKYIQRNDEIICKLLLNENNEIDIKHYTKYCS